MNTTLFILNEAPYGSERADNALRLAGTLAGKEDQPVWVFLLADAVTCARAGQKVPEGYYNIALMLGRVAGSGEIGVCGTCMDHRGLLDADLIEGTRRSSLVELTDWTVMANKVLVF